jgi:response regulator of citrate/malate metabolism
VGAGGLVIRTVVVDDDFMAASVHRGFAERVPGFTVVGEGPSGADALALVERLEPDLLLLDIYLPDMSGIEVMRRLRARDDAEVDVIAITSAKDVKTLRGAMHQGVVHYLIKPFSFSVFRERLETYAALKARLDGIHHADQGQVDKLYALLRSRGDDSLPKGISAPTLELVVNALREAQDEVTAVTIAERTGISRGTARRYLEYLALTGAIELSLRYGATGRPEHLYRWADRVPADA